MYVALGPYLKMICTTVLIILANLSCHLSFVGISGNSVMWQQKWRISFYTTRRKSKSQGGRAFVLREAHHEECARRLNEKYGNNFTWKQTYNNSTSTISSKQNGS